ncbi:tetratricopeptide repeat protein [Elusimicrobiota bacterium]
MRGDFKKALGHARKALGLTKKGVDPRTELETCWEYLACVKILRSSSDKTSTSALKRALYLGKTSPDKMLYAETLARHGSLLRNWGKHKEAISALLKSLRILNACGSDREMQGFIHWNLGFSYRMIFKTKESHASFKKSLSIFRSIADNSAIAYALCGLAGITRIRGDYRACYDLYKKANLLFKNENDTYGTAYSSCGMGNGLRRLGLYKQAIPNYTKALKLYIRMDDKVNCGYVLWGRYICHKELDIGAKAKSDLLRARKIFLAEKDDRGLALLNVWAGMKSKVSCAAALKEASCS